MSSRPGWSITKSLGLDQGFPGMTSSVTLGITNVGTGPVFNATLCSAAGFLRLRPEWRLHYEDLRHTRADAI